MDEERAAAPVYGKNAVAELLKSGTPVDTVLLADSLQPGTVSYITALARQAGAVVKRAPTDKLNTLCSTTGHQGIAAVAAQVAYCDLDDVLAAAAAKGEAPFLLLCDGIEDPHNLGALIRSALLCGAHGVVIPKRGGTGVTPVVMKASAGAAAHLPIARVTNLNEAIRSLKKQNVFVYCADMDGIPLPKQDLSGAIALVMGGEGRGVSPLVKKNCDGAVSLPMAAASGPDSFNVSVAGGVLMYHVFQRRAGT